MFLEQENFIPDAAPVRHGFFGRQGGVSDGIYESLNCGSGSSDRPELVAQNRQYVAQKMGVEEDHLLSLHQIHSATCLHITAPFQVRPKADAFVTDKPGLALGVLTADCGPVLFYGEKSDGSPVIGAAHAGWRGALSGVLDETIRTFQTLDVSVGHIRAAVGPCIGQASYEVSQEFSTAFLEDDPANEHFFKAARKEAHLMFDLQGYIARRLALLGVQTVLLSGKDTYADEAQYFSYRRTTHRNEPDYGRQVSAIAIQIPK